MPPAAKGARIYALFIRTARCLLSQARLRLKALWNPFTGYGMEAGSLTADAGFIPARAENGAVHFYFRRSYAAFCRQCKYVVHGTAV